MPYVSIYMMDVSPALSPVSLRDCLVRLAEAADHARLRSVADDAPRTGTRRGDPGGRILLPLGWRHPAQAAARTADVP